MKYLSESVGSLDKGRDVRRQQCPNSCNAFPSHLLALTQMRIADYNALGTLCEHVLDQ